MGIIIEINKQYICLVKNLEKNIILDFILENID